MNKNENFKIKLILPCSFDDELPYNFIPYGMGIVAAFLKNNKYHVEQEDLHVKFNRHRHQFFPSLNPDKSIYIQEYQDEMQNMLETGDFNCRLGLIIDNLLDSVSLDGFNLIGFSVNSPFSLPFALLTSMRIKRNKNIPVVFGGTFITIYGHLYPDILNYADFMIIGDGGEPMLRLIDYLNGDIPVCEVPNLNYKENGQLKNTPGKRYPLEEAPAPDFESLPLNLYNNHGLKGGIILPYQVTRGCTGRCSFCIYRYVNTKLEFKTYEKVVDELNQLKHKYGSKKFRFWDAALNNSKEYLLGLCNFFIKKELNISWSTQLKISNLDRCIFSKMKQAGCQCVEFGVESGSDVILEKMNKGFTSEEASKALKYSAEAGLRNRALFITGFPDETEEDIDKSVGFIQNNRKYIHEAVLHNFVLSYGSAMHYEPDKYGVTSLKLTPFSRTSFIFSDSIGLTWEEKQKQQKHSYEEVKKAIGKYIKNGNSAFTFYNKLY